MQTFPTGSAGEAGQGRCLFGCFCVVSMFSDVVNLVTGRPADDMIWFHLPPHRAGRGRRQAGGSAGACSLQLTLCTCCSSTTLCVLPPSSPQAEGGAKPAAALEPIPAVEWWDARILVDKSSYGGVVDGEPAQVGDLTLYLQLRDGRIA